VSATGLALVSLAAFLVFYAAFVLALALAGRGSDARALARFIPDCLVFLRRLLGDERIARSRKLALLLLIGYLASPIDLVPDFVPVVGQLDDAILAALVLRFVLRGADPSLIDRQWPGPPQGARLIHRLAFGARGRASAASPNPY